MSRTKKFLLVDDDTDDSFLFGEVLAEVDPTIQFETASNGQEALEHLVTEGKPLPDVIFMDLNMPRMDGKQCLFEIKQNERLQHIPVMMYTTSSHSTDIEQSMQLGAICFITKPSDSKELKNILSIIANNAHNLAKALPILSNQSTWILC